MSKLRFFIKTLRTQKFDIVHFHTTQQLIPEIVCALYFSKARVVLAEYGSYLVKPRFDQHSFLFKIAIRLVHKKVNALIVMSNFLKSELASNAAEKAIVIGNLIDDNWFERPIQRNESKDFYRFLHISTADENKNVEGIILACLILKTSGYTNFRTRIVSDESIIDLQELVKKLGLIDFVTFDGPIAHDQIGKVYQDADCFLLNSRIETFSIVAAEALCCGLHLISTPVGFVLDLSTDLYTKTEINNNESLAEAMKTAISKNKFNGYSGRLAVEQFKNSRIQAAYQQVYHNLQKQ